MNTTSKYILSGIMAVFVLAAIALYVVIEYEILFNNETSDLVYQSDQASTSETIVIPNTVTLDESTYEEYNGAVRDGQYSQAVAALEQDLSSAELTESQKAESVLINYKALILGDTGDGVATERAISLLSDMATQDQTYSQTQRAYAFLLLARVHMYSGFDPQVLAKIQAVESLRPYYASGETLIDLYDASFALEPTYSAAYALARLHAQQLPLDPQTQLSEEQTKHQTLSANYLLAGNALKREADRTQPEHVRSERLVYAQTDWAYVLSVFNARNNDIVLEEGEQFYADMFYYIYTRLTEDFTVDSLENFWYPYVVMYAAGFRQNQGNTQEVDELMTSLATFVQNRDMNFNGSFTDYLDHVDETTRGRTIHPSQRFTDRLAKASTGFRSLLQTAQ